MKAKTHWVWTHKAERDSRGRNRAGTPVHDMWREEVPAFVLEQKRKLKEELSNIVSK